MQTKTRGYICVHIPWLHSTVNLTLGQMDLDALALANGWCLFSTLYGYVRTVGMFALVNCKLGTAFSQNKK